MLNVVVNVLNNSNNYMRICVFLLESGVQLYCDGSIYWAYSKWFHGPSSVFLLHCPSKCDGLKSATARNVSSSQHYHRHYKQTIWLSSIPRDVITQKLRLLKLNVFQCLVR